MFTDGDAENVKSNSNKERHRERERGADLARSWRIICANERVMLVGLCVMINLAETLNAVPFIDTICNKIFLFSTFKWILYRHWCCCCCCNGILVVTFVVIINHNKNCVLFNIIRHYHRECLITRWKNCHFRLDCVICHFCRRMWSGAHLSVSKNSLEIYWMIRCQLTVSLYFIGSVLKCMLKAYVHHRHSEMNVII